MDKKESKVSQLQIQIWCGWKGRTRAQEVASEDKVEDETARAERGAVLCSQVAQGERRPKDLRYEIRPKTCYPERAEVLRRLRVERQRSEVLKVRRKRHSSARLRQASGTDERWTHVVLHQVETE
jgi:hypothetical protein